MLRTLRNSAAMIVASAALALPLAAQTTPAPETAPSTAPAETAPAAPAVVPATPATPATPAAPEVAAPAAPAAPLAVPQALTDLGATDTTVRQGRRGVQMAQGTLPGGTGFQAMLDSNGALRMIRATGDGASLPADIVARLVPEAVRGNAIFSEFASIRGVGIGGHGPRPAAGAAEGVMVFGTDAGGQGLRAGFAADGTMQAFGRGDMDRGGWGKKDGKHWGKGHQGGKHWRGERRGERGPMPGAAPGAAQAAPALDDAAVTRILGEAGYTQPGAITRDGGRLDVEAVNPNGEPVTVTIGPRGVVTRELAR